MIVMGSRIKPRSSAGKHCAAPRDSVTNGRNTSAHTNTLKVLEQTARHGLATLSGSINSCQVQGKDRKEPALSFPIIMHFFLTFSRD